MSKAEQLTFQEPLMGDEWARLNPQQHAQEVAQTKARVLAAKQRLIQGQSVKLGDLDRRTTRDFQNEWHRDFRQRMAEE